MPLEDVKSLKKPSGARSLQSGFFSASSKFRKRQASDTSITSSLGRSTAESGGGEDYTVSVTRVGMETPPRPILHHAGSSISSGSEPDTGSSRGHIRLVHQQIASDQESAAADADGMSTVMEDLEPIVYSPEPMSSHPSSRPSTPSQPIFDYSRATPPPRTMTPQPSTSRIHWNQLRNAVIPGASASSHPVSQSNSIHTQSTVTGLPPRSQTPKPSRLARFGFRQVVDQTREVVQDHTNRFEADIYRACEISRFGEMKHKAEREGSQGGGYLPFMSTTSLPLAATPAASQVRLIQQNEILIQSGPSLKLLHQTLMRYIPMSGADGPIRLLPYEPEVLSVLLIPFTMTFGRLEDEERLLAIETFEIAVKTWPPSSSQRGIDRILWCCKAALFNSEVRSRVVAFLSTTLFSTTPLENGNPLALQNVLQGLQLLLHEFSKSQNSLGDVQLIRELCTRVRNGSCGKLDKREIETEYEEQWGSQDNEESTRVQIVTEGIVRCMQNGSEGLRRWILHHSVETYWTPIEGALSPLHKKIVARRISAFLRASLSLLHLDTIEPQQHFLNFDSMIILRLLTLRALPELKHLPLPKHMNDGRALIVELLLELLSLEIPHQKHEVVKLIGGWCEDVDGWKESLEIGLRLFVEKVDWSHLATVLLKATQEFTDKIQEIIVSCLLPALHTRLVVDPAPYPLPALTALLRSLSQRYPHRFYKPLLTLASASKDVTIVGQLGIVIALARHLPEFWIGDPEMISVVLMRDVGSAIGKGKAKEEDPIPWGKAKMGQSLIMLELICCIKDLNRSKKDASSPPDASLNPAYRFLTGLEARLAILLEAKEKIALVPLSQRTLLSILFLEIRLFTRSLKPAQWLSKVVTWTEQSFLGAKAEQGDRSFIDSDQAKEVVHEEAFDEVISTIAKIRSIYIACWQSPLSNARCSTIALSPASDPQSPGAAAVKPEIYDAATKEREELIASLSTGVASATLRLLVAICGLLTQAEHCRIGPVIWSHLLDVNDPRVVAPACFLLTHGLEKMSKDIMTCIENDRCSPRSAVRQAFVRRLMTLFAWRSQILSQTYIYDRARRRPFKLARQPIAFVAIDVGSGSYVHEETEEDRKNRPGGALPLDLRKRLAEVGWEQEDQPTDTRIERVRAPMSLFSVSQLDRPHTSQDQAVMPQSRSAESVQLLRRKSSTSAHHPGTKRRAVFVPALVSMFSSVALLTTDPDPVVASAAREAILLLLRDDPAMLCRPVMETLGADLTQTSSAVSILRAFLHTHRRLPPSASHHIFSHLGGFLKHVSREADNPKALRAFSYTLPILAKLITQVSNLSIRDLRRSKFEIYVFPSGSLWFPPTAPSSSMFPQSLGPMINPFEELPPQLVGILMVRTAQNMLLLDMLKHRPQEVHVIRKNFTGLVLPGENTGKDLDANNFLPRRDSKTRLSRSTFHQASLALSRSHLLLLGQIFRSMSRNFNSKAELARLFDGINRILLIHGDDIGIVAHALIACMVAVTRFRRLVSSSDGFALFMPSLLKVYAEAEGHVGIRHAIQYASSRFYAIHQEAYLFQSIDLASNILVRLELPADQDWWAKNIYRLFSALKAQPYRTSLDAAGIRDLNKAEEREALITTTVTDETPQTGVQDSPRGEQLKRILAIGQYEDKLLQLDDFVRFFLTVIAHDPTVIRAQNFLSMFQRMTSEFYNGSNSAREVLREGINALSSALFSRTSRSRIPDIMQTRSHQPSATDPHESTRSASLFDDPSLPCDPVIIRREYLKLIVAFTRMGGDLRHGTIRRALDIVKILLKESASPQSEAESTFLQELTSTSLLRLSVSPKQAIALLSDVAPVVRAFSLSVDCTGVLETVDQLLERPELATNRAFMHLVVDQIIGPSLEACNDAASENLLMGLPMRPAVVSLVGHAATLWSSDVASIIEKQPPSPGFLAGVMLPLCLTIKTSNEITVGDRWRDRDSTAKYGLIFVRLLAYIMDACYTNFEGEAGRTSPLPSLNRRESQRSKRSSLSASRIPLATLTITLQIIKVIVLRAAGDLSEGLTGIWARLARFLQQLLDNGDARFALSSGSSPAPSPGQSPKLDPSSSWSHGRQHSSSSDNHHPTSPSVNIGAPRVVDYLTWSLLEYLCCAPSPLTLQMRLWMQERVLSLDTELKSRELASPFVGNRSRRLSSSVFSKPRLSSLSPDALRASHGVSSTPSELNLSASTSTDFTAYNRFSNSPSRRSLQPAWKGPRIIHLGPSMDHQHFIHPMERSSSQDSALKTLARTSYISLPSLIRSTYSRVRLVQIFMGYDHLLPIEGQDSDVGELNLKAWGMASTLAMLVGESKELMEEIPEAYYENVGEDFVDVRPGSEVFSQQSSPIKGL